MLYLFKKFNKHNLMLDLHCDGQLLELYFKLN